MAALSLEWSWGSASTESEAALDEEEEEKDESPNRWIMFDNEYGTGTTTWALDGSQST